MRPKKIDIYQAPATNQPTQNIPLFQDYIMIICFACYAFLLIILCNLTYESIFLFIFLTYHLYCTTLISNRYTTNTDTEHQRTTHTNYTDNTTAVIIGSINISVIIITFISEDKRGNFL